ncbi:hypothetical protein HNP99_001460 [Flavobacterium sp. 28A]|uniref:hypothetical protein n=1 Tax=Flavobacterium sp. 28A TaxID=2735895 RepID=UPI0015709E66|nr:hypothetical protein [Flavobacterium sp. 28A]NRT15113.1 hypothetical protein [Flavobacterium sp. 28A]
MKNLRNLWSFHLLTTVGFYLLTNNGGGDAWGYWTLARRMNFNDFIVNIQTAKGTYFMHALNYFPANVLDMDFFTNTLLFSLLGYIGITFFYTICEQVVPNNTYYSKFWLFPLLFFMPNLHFWSSGIGKDTILFMCIGMFCYAMLNVIKRLPLLILSLLISYLVRPHIALFLVVSFGMAYLFSNKVSGFKRIFFMIVLLGGGIAILPSVMEYVKIEEISADSISKYSESKALVLSGKNTGSSVDIASYPLPLKIFTFLFRPFFFDINGVPAIIASFENLALLLLTIKAFKKDRIETFRKAPFIIKGLFIFLLIGTLAFSQSLGNVGIMIRMRNMLLPGLLIYILWALSYQKQKKKALQVSKGNLI